MKRKNRRITKAEETRLAEISRLHWAQIEAGCKTRTKAKTKKV